MKANAIAFTILIWIAFAATFGGIMFADYLFGGIAWSSWDLYLFFGLIGFVACSALSALSLMLAFSDECHKPPFDPMRHLSPGERRLRE